VSRKPCSRCHMPRLQHGSDCDLCAIWCVLFCFNSTLRYQVGTSCLPHRSCICFGCLHLYCTLSPHLERMLITVAALFLHVRNTLNGHCLREVLQCFSCDSRRTQRMVTALNNSHRPAVSTQRKTERNDYLSCAPGCPDRLTVTRYMLLLRLFSHD
jgi:hypothetical protein